MYVWGRMIRVATVALFKKRLPPLEASVISFMVSPVDLDAYFHMNNGRYLAVMDLGRLDLFLRNGLARVSLKKKWQPIVSQVQIDYRKVLPPFAVFRLRTRVLCREGYALFVEAIFERSDDEVTRAIVKMVILGTGRKRIPVRDVVTQLGYHGDPPVLPQEVKSWQERRKR